MRSHGSTHPPPFSFPRSVSRSRFQAVKFQVSSDFRAREGLIPRPAVEKAWTIAVGPHRSWEQRSFACLYSEMRFRSANEFRPSLSTFHLDGTL